MKKFKILLVLFALAGAFGARAFQKFDPQYYRNSSGDVVEITTDGVCAFEDNDIYCKYEHITGQPFDNDLENHYTPVTTTLDRKWVPDPPAK
jgi:hypothetical protein